MCSVYTNCVCSLLSLLFKRIVLLLKQQQEIQQSDVVEKCYRVMLVVFSIAENQSALT